MNRESGLEIAVVGGGVAGIVASWLLQRRHRVTLYEKNHYIGGHTRTIVVDDGRERTPVDTGFIVFNDRTYPKFIRFIEQLGVDRVKSPMSFSYSDSQTGFTYNTSAPFADRKNRLRPSYWRFLAEIFRFNRLTRRLLETGRLRDLTLAQYLKRYRFSREFTEQYVIPMGAAIWSAPDKDIAIFPAETFARFFENHNLLTITGHPQWYTIKGGSQEYVRAFLKRFAGDVFPGRPVRSIVRESDRVRLSTDDGEAEFDGVVIAAHADEALNMLADPTVEETLLLSKWQYTKNRVVLHRDAACLPQIEKSRAAWNYMRESDKAQQPVLTMTYYMNLLQQLATKTHYCVTLNPQRPIDPVHIVADLVYEHPRFTAEAVETQMALDHLNGQNNTYFCGSYFRYGFHEDAVMAAVAVGEKFGIAL